MTESIMYPAPVCPPNNLRRGNFVVHEDGTRGVVVCDPGKMRRTNRFVDQLTSPESVAISTGASCSTVTDNHHRKWTVVPEKDLTPSESVKCTAAIASILDSNEVFRFLMADLLNRSSSKRAVLNYDYDQTVCDMAAVVADYIEGLENCLAEAFDKNGNPL